MITVYTARNANHCAHLDASQLFASRIELFLRGFAGAALLRQALKRCVAFPLDPLQVGAHLESMTAHK